MNGMADLPKAKWDAVGRQVILKDDFSDIELAILQVFELLTMPTLTWLDATAVKVLATADTLSRVMMSGFPNILHKGQFITASLTDRKYRENDSDTTMDFDVAASLWGTEKASQWYCIYAIAGDADPTFTLKAMPYCTYKSQASQVISLGTFLTPATGIGYGFTTDEFVDSKIYVLSGASKGLVRTILHNNNDNTTGGTIEYSGAALTMSQGDRFIILPETNFRWLGDVFNNASSNLTEIDDIIFGKEIYAYTTVGTFYWTCPLMWSACFASGCGSGSGGYSGSGAGDGGGRGGQAGQETHFQQLACVGGTVYTITIPAGGTTGSAGATTSIGALLSLTGGAAVTDYTGVNPDIIDSGEHGQGGGFGRGGRGGCAAGAGPVPSGSVPDSGFGGGGGGGRTGQVGASGRLGCLFIFKHAINIL